MTSENSDLLVHDVIGRLFEEPEPLHRADLADGAIAQGMAVTRRRGFAVAGATVSVLAVVAGTMAVAGGGRGNGNDWSLAPDARQVAPQAFEDPAPSYSDRQREIMAQLPGALGPLLPAGMTLSRDPEHTFGSTSMLTGDFGPAFVLRSGGTTYYLSIDIDGTGSPNAPATRVAVTGGSILMAVSHAPDSRSGGSSSAWYEFAPSDAAAPKFSFTIDGPGDTAPIDIAAFKKMVEAQGFTKVRQLMDPNVRASAAAVKHRYALEAQINAEAARILPPGFRLKLNPAAPEMIELVGPEGVNTFDWEVFTGPKPQNACGAGFLCYAPDHDTKGGRVGPDGVARLGVYWSGSGAPADPQFSFSVFGTPRTGKNTATYWPILGKDGSETAPQGPGLTPQQARAIMKAPGAAKVIADVQKLVDQG